VLKHVHRLWGFEVVLESVWADEIKQTYRCPPKPVQEELGS